MLRLLIVVVCLFAAVDADAAVTGGQKDLAPPSHANEQFNGSAQTAAGRLHKTSTRLPSTAFNDKAGVTTASEAPRVQPAPVLPPTLSSHDQLTSQTRAWLTAALEEVPRASRYEFTTPRIDERLAVPVCRTPFTFSHTGNLAGRILLRAQCRQPLWATHLPIDITLYKTIVFSKKSLKRGARLADDDVELQEAAVTRLPQGYLTDTDEAIGQELTRNLKSGAVISTGMLTRPDAVERGDAVTIVAGRDRMEVRATGIAVTGGPVGKQITVRNTATDRVVKGWVRGPGEVYVPF